MIESLLRIARRATLPVLLSCAAPAAIAGPITIDEADLDSIFAQASIDVRVAAARTIVNAAWAIMSFDDFFAASAYVTAPAQGLSPLAMPVVFIDDFDADVGGAVVGLGTLGGRFSAVESAFVALPVLGTNVIAHELGHNLGLDHDLSFFNLMSPGVDFATRQLLAYQIDAILASPFVQTDALGQLYIEVAPFAVLAAQAVPEPGALLLLLGGLGGVVLMRRRRA